MLIICVYIFSVSDHDVESHKLRDTKDITPIAKTVPLKKKNGSWKNQLEKRIYILSWIKKYDKSSAISDVIAGITLGLTMIPQAIAYAALAGLPSQYGLYSAFVGKYYHYN